MLTPEPIHTWVDAPGEYVSWGPAPASLKKAQESSVSAVPASYQQEQHLRTYREHVASDTEMARLVIPAWDIPGRCDIRAMTHVINAYLRRHDTYRSWFEFDGSDRVVRHTIQNPRDVKFVATQHGVMTAREWREHILATPGPLDWDCFRFGLVQHPDHFTFYMSVDHLHIDGTFMGLAFVEIHMMYAVLVEGGAPIPLPEAGTYDDYCLRQRSFTSSLTWDSSQVRRWVTFADGNNGSLPRFPLPLGDRTVHYEGDLLTVQMMDEEQTNRFESVCTDVGVRFFGGVLGATALAEYELTGADTYYVITPTSTRTTPADMMTTGWYTGTVPVTVPISAGSFAETARAAQTSFDTDIELAHVPFDRVVELAGSHGRVRKPSPGVAMVSYLDSTVPPLSPALVAEWNGLKGKLYSQRAAAHQIGIWVNRLGNGTSVTMAFPSNPIARDSVTRYLEAMKATFVRVSEGRGEMSRVAESVDMDLNPA